MSIKKNGTTNPSGKLEVGAAGKKSFQVRPDTNYVSLLVDGGGGGFG